MGSIHDGPAGIGRNGRPAARYEAPKAVRREDQGVDEGSGAALKATRRPDARQSPHEEAQIQAADVHKEALEHVGVPAQMHAAQSPGFVEMGVGTLEALAALPQQAPSAATSAITTPADGGSPGRPEPSGGPA